MKEIIKRNNNIDFTVHPYIELLSVIQILSEHNKGKFEDWYANNTFYIDKINTYFKDYKNHPAIINYKKYNIGNSNIITLDSNSNEVLNNYYKDIKDFVIKSNYIEFFESMKEYYNKVLEYNLNNTDIPNISESLNNYYNKNINIKVILKMIQGDWGEYLTNENDNYIVLCGILKIDELPLFINKKQLISLCFHECTHPFIHKYITTDYDLLEKTENLFINIDNNSIAKKNYFTYNDYLEDLIVRAVTAVIKLKYKYKTKEEYEEELTLMQNIGFTYIKDIASILEENDFYTSINLIKEYLYKKINEIKGDKNETIQR